MKRLYSLMMCLTLIIPLSLSAENISVAAAKWREFSEPDGNGIYLQLIKRIYSKDTVHFDVGSFARAKRKFSAQEADILVGIYKDDLDHLDRAILPNTHLDMEFPVLAIFDPKRHQIKTVDDLSHLVVGWYEEYKYGRFAPKDVVVRPFDDIAKGLSLLEAGRFDVVIDHEYNLDDKQRKTLKSIVLSGEKPIWLAFQNTPKGKALKNIYDTEMAKLRDSGELAHIYGAEYARAKLEQKFSH